MRITRHHAGPGARFQWEVQGRHVGTHPGRCGSRRSPTERELESFASKGFWRKKTRAEAFARTGHPPISVRWIAFNNGDEFNHRYRSRLVARQLKVQARPGLRASRRRRPWRRSGQSSRVPPQRLGLGAQVIVRSCRVACRSRSWTSPEITSTPKLFRRYLPSCNCRQRILAQELCVLSCSDTCLGRAPRRTVGNEESSTSLVADCRFEPGVAPPCFFKHPEKSIVLTVHVDDFTAAGPKHDLDWSETMMKERYELTTRPRVGLADEDTKEAVELRRIVRWCSHGIEYESDPRQVDKLLAQCGLVGANSVATCGVRASFAEVENGEPFSSRPRAASRGAAARANLLGSRPDPLPVCCGAYMPL